MQELKTERHCLRLPVSSAPDGPADPRWSITAASNRCSSVPSFYLYHRMERCLGRFHFAILHQSGRHKTEASEELMGPRARGDAWGICNRRRETT